MTSNKSPIKIIENLQNQTSYTQLTKKQDISCNSAMNNSSFNELTTYYQSPLLQTLANVHQRSKSNVLTYRNNSNNFWQESSHSNLKQNGSIKIASQVIPQQSEFPIQTFQNKEIFSTPIQKQNIENQLIPRVLESEFNSFKKSQSLSSQQKYNTPCQDNQNSSLAQNYFSQNPKQANQDSGNQSSFRNKSFHQEQQSCFNQNILQNNIQLQNQVQSIKNFYPQNQDQFLNQLASNYQKENNNSTGFRTSNLQSDRMNEYIQKLNFVSNQQIGKICNMKMFAQSNIENIPQSILSQRSQSHQQSVQNQSQIQNNLQQLNQAILFQPINSSSSTRFQQNTINKNDQPLKEKKLNGNIGSILQIVDNSANFEGKEYQKSRQIQQQQIDLNKYQHQNISLLNQTNSQHTSNFNQLNQTNLISKTNSNSNKNFTHNNLQKSSSQNSLTQNIKKNENSLNQQQSVKCLKSPTKDILHKIFYQNGRTFDDLKSENEGQAFNQNNQQNKETKLEISQINQDQTEQQRQFYNSVPIKSSNKQSINLIDENNFRQSLIAINGSEEINHTLEEDIQNSKYIKSEQKKTKNYSQINQQRMKNMNQNQQESSESIKIVFESIESINKPHEFSQDQLPQDFSTKNLNFQSQNQFQKVSLEQQCQLPLQDKTNVTNHTQYKKQLLQNIVKGLERDSSFEKICKKNYETIKSGEKSKVSKENLNNTLHSPKNQENNNNNNQHNFVQNQNDNNSINYFQNDIQQQNNQFSNNQKIIQQNEITNLYQIIDDLKRKNAILIQNSQVQNYIRLQSQMMKQEGQTKLLQKELKIQKQLNKNLEEQLEKYLNHINFNSVRNQ
ncbi:hypothetical protein TTHERM_00535900 (macronuclear) [Tetrahymena thermophila SB210]|uniref:Uncharacterized protein n=1 Tax=Tetrahymena thermophila (strain SB210) TaxID=312017 RepID=I7MHT5_TETTS|nr:hypothetical protein TTHERM_00535900 [Tetrahymena thermophila SB210]EAS03254.2 hypothetical protein TTHERM_00535900 [Tetrahymena thermophila SB210]|eukprot:XP_001023499.2 hypothetical protein TTHERM_00535900 [Tetrahymena thermophila SB210]